MEKVSKNLPLIFLLILAILTSAVWYAVFYFESHKGLQVIFFDVGQGDSILIQHNGSTQVLIDGGPDDRVLSKLGRELPFWDRSLDALILTHPDKDHIAGLVEVLRRYKIDLVLWTGVLHSNTEYQEWIKLLKEKKIPVAIVYTGKRLKIGEGIYLDVLAPFENLNAQSVTKLNDTSMVAKLQQGHTSILFMGDASKTVEHRLLFQSYGVLDSDILKIGHHGSKTSTSEKFLEAVSPEMAVISAGRKNRYGHPHQEVLDRLTQFGSNVFRTDEKGDIRFSSDGKKFSAE
jgi:competence protein ComEC